MRISSPHRIKVNMPAGKKIQYVIFDMDGSSPSFVTTRDDKITLKTGLMIDSERVYTDVTSD